MKHILFFLIFLVGGGFALTATAQVSGRWVECWDHAYDRPAQCFIPDRVQPQGSPIRHRIDYRGEYRDGYYDQYQQPAYQRQRVKTVRQDWDGGLNPYSRRPYVRYSRSTETTTIIVETNDTNYRPDIRVVTSGRYYYWPY